MKTLTNQLLSDLNTSYWEFLHQESFDKAFVKLQEKVAQNTVYGTFKETNEVPAFHEREIPISHITHLITNIRIVDNKIIVEVKATEKNHSIYETQILTYLRLTRQPVGLLINFGASTLKEGLHHVVNRLDPSASPRLRVNQPTP